MITDNHTTHSLQTLSEAFSQWRQSRPYLRSPVPDELRRKAVGMLSQYSVSQIIEALGITRDMLRNWQKDQADGTCPDTEFISLPMPESELAESPEPITVTVTLSQNRAVCLQGAFSPEQLTALMRGVVAGMEEAK